jgi:glycosyltransferase involved in cell wall biosynthesis
MILVSVIIPVFNQKQNIVSLVNSLFTQTYPRDKFEIIIVDNGSVDGTFEELQKYADIIALQESFPSSYAARAIGVNHAKGEILAFMDSDEIADKYWIENGVNALKDASYAGGKIMHQDSRRYFLSLYDEYIINYKRQTTSNDSKIICAGNFFIWKVEYIKIGGFDAKLISGGDTMISLAAKEKGLKFSFVENSIVYHPVDTHFRRIKKAFRLSRASIAKSKSERTSSKDYLLNFISVIREQFGLISMNFKQGNVHFGETLVLYCITLYFISISYLGRFIGKYLSSDKLVRW